MKKFFQTLIMAVIFGFTPMSSMAQGHPFPKGASWENGFSIDGTALPLILKVIDSAQKQILVAAYAFTNRDITRELIRVHKEKGVQVFVVADEKENQKYTSLGYLVRAGIPVRLNNHYAIMHNKFMVVDGITLQTGSFNYTQTAVTENAENVLVNWNFYDEAQNYTNDWSALWNGGYNYTYH